METATNIILICQNIKKATKKKKLQQRFIWLYKPGEKKKYQETDYVGQTRERCQICHPSAIRNTHAAL